MLVSEGLSWHTGPVLLPELPPGLLPMSVNRTLKGNVNQLPKMFTAAERN